MLVYKCLHEATPTDLAEMVTPVTASVSRRHLRSAINTRRSGSTALQDDEIWTKKLRRLWSDPVEHTTADHASPITDIDSVLCTLEDHAVLQSL